MSKNIIQALIIAFLLWIIPFVFNVVSGGGLIRLLGGVTQQEFQKAIRAGETIQLRYRPDGRRVLYGDIHDQTVRVELDHNITEQQWQIERVPQAPAP